MAACMVSQNKVRSSSMTFASNKLFDFPFEDWTTIAISSPMHSGPETLKLCVHSFQTLDKTVFASATFFSSSLRYIGDSITEHGPKSLQSRKVLLPEQSLRIAVRLLAVQVTDLSIVRQAGRLGGVLCAVWAYTYTSVPHFVRHHPSDAKAAQ